MPYSLRSINTWIEKCRERGILHYKETDPLLYNALDEHPIEGKSVLIIGSQEPCYEALALERGASSVTVVEYRKIESGCGKIRYITVDEFAEESIQYDCALSISSVEHTGLGRYGDPIDEDGDLKAMDELHSKLKEGGICFLSVPTGVDFIKGDLHRVYGNERLPKLINNWKVLGTFKYETNPFELEQPVFVLRKEQHGIHKIQTRKLHRSTPYHH